MSEIIRSASISGIRPLTQNKPDARGNSSLTPSQDRSSIGGAVQASEEGYLKDGDSSRSAISESVASDILIALQKQNESLNSQLDEVKRNYELLLSQQDKQIQEQMERGYDAGFRKGIARAEETLRDKLTSISSAIEALNEATKLQLVDIEDIAVELGFSAFLRLVGEHFADEKFVRALTKNALQEVKDGISISVHVSPSDFAVIQAGFSKPASDTASKLVHDGIQIIADPRIQLGGCIVEAGSGAWDARLEAQIVRLKEAIVHAKTQR